MLWKEIFLIGRLLYGKVEEGLGGQIEFGWGLRENTVDFSTGRGSVPGHGSMNKKK